MNVSNQRVETTVDTASQLHRSVLRLLRLLEATRPTKELSFSKLAVLGRLYRGGRATATALAAYLRIQPQSLTRLLTDLERRQLITRRQDDEDRRQRLLEITETGKQVMMEEIGAQRLKLAETMAAELTATEQELLRLAAGLMDRLSFLADEETAALGSRAQYKARRVHTGGAKKDVEG